MLRVTAAARRLVLRHLHGRMAVLTDPGLQQGCSSSLCLRLMMLEPASQLQNDTTTVSVNRRLELWFCV